MEPLTLIALLAFLSLIVCWMVLPADAAPTGEPIAEATLMEASAATV
ncbi:MAG: hypothetical protein HY331_17550 [Chloroflexi bacterium]|nr:hypothetical protein [Chloroflexota bacterium]